MIIFACAACGSHMSSGLKKRCEYLDAYAASLESLKAHICFSDFPLEKALRLAGEASAVSDAFSAAADAMKSLGIKKAWDTAVRGTSEAFCLTRADEDALAALGSRLGLTDVEDQKRNIDGVLASLAPLRKQARSQYETNGRLYRSGAVLCGILAAVLLI